MASIPRSAVRIALQALLALAWSARPAPGGAVTTAPTSSDLKASTLDPAENVPGSADSFVFTGAATHEIPIAVPQGRLGMAPNIDLIYNSQKKQEEGFLGMGWSLPLEAIERKLEGGVKYNACEQGCEVAYVKGGAAMALVRGVSGEYRSKIDDGANVRVQYDATTASWTAYDKNGRSYHYGRTAASRQDDPANAARIFKWCLDRVEDSNGNYLTISYAKDSGQIYPGEIQYTGNSSPGLALPLVPKTTVRFALAARLNDYPVDKYWVRSDLRGFNVITAFYVAEINVLVDGVLAWKYALEYAYSSLTQRLLLKKVRRFGEGGTKELLPSIDLTWTPGPGFGLGWNQDSSYRQETWTSGGSGAIRATGDFNGDGRSDHANTSPGTWSWTVNLGSDTKFETATWSTKNYPAYETGAKVVTGDFNGDGRTEIAYSKPGWYSWRVETWNGTGLDVNDWWTTFSGCTDDTCRAVGYGDGHDFVVVGDFDGDGKTDVAHARDRWGGWVVSLSTGSTFQAQYWPVSSGFAIDWIVDGKEWVLVGDFNGDGKTDIAHTRPDWRYWQIHLSNGINGFTTANWYGACASCTQGYTDGSEYFVAGDFDGDGKTDIARHWLYHIEHEIGRSGFAFYRSTGSDFQVQGDSTTGCEFYTAADPAYWDEYRRTCVKGYSSQAAYPSCSGGFGCVQYPCYNWCQYGLPCTFALPPITALTGDFNGDGKVDIALGDPTRDYWSVYHQNGCFRIPYPGSAGIPGDFTGTGRTDIFNGNLMLRDTGQPPDLLASATNGRGGATEFTYTSSSKFPNTVLPFAIPLVSSVKVKDGMGNEASTTYAYQGGYYDLGAKEFRGFRSATRTNPDGTTVQTWFHQKDDAAVTWTQAEDVDFKGKVRHLEVKDATGKVISATDYTWARTPAKGLSPPYPVMVQLQKARVTDTVGGVAVFRETANTYDAYGNTTTVAVSGTDGESITTTIVPVDWGTPPRSVWKPQKTTVTGSTSGKIREATFNYSVGTGNLEWSEPWLNGGVNPRTNYTYYPEGNLETITDPLGRVTRFDYEPARTFPDLIEYPKTGTTPQVSHRILASYDYIHGQADNAWDENGNKTHVDFDDFGRPTAITVYVADGPQIAAKRKFEYFDSAVAGVPSSVKTSVLESVSGTTETYILVGYEYLDGLGRSIETVSPAATWASDGKTVISRTSYDAMGRPWFLRGPFFGSGVNYGQTPPPQHPWVQRDYDGTGRLGATRRSDGQAGEAVTTLSYSGSTVTVTDPDQKKTSWKRDYLGRTIEVTEYGDGGAVYTTKYTHDAAGQLKRIDDHRLNYWTFDYDTLGRKKGMRDPDAGAWSYEHYADGALRWQTDAKGVRVDFAYDDLNRIKTLTYSNGQPTVTYTYDTAPNGIGRLAGVSVGQAVVESVNEYDALGRPRSASKTIAGNASMFTSATDFDLAGRLSALVYPDGYRVGYEYYTGTDVLQGVRGSDATLYATFTGHDLSGQPGILSFGNGARTHHTRDELSMKLTGIVTEIPAPGGTGMDLLNIAITSSGAGDVTKLSDYKKGADLGLAGGVFEYAYGHDALHRLRRETLTQPLGTTSQDITYQRHPTIAHAFESVTRSGSTHLFAYDANGNTTTGWDLSDTLAVGKRQVDVNDYNADNLPTRLVYSRGGLTRTAEYLYDGAGMRARKSVGLDTTFYVGKHYEVVNGEPVKYIFAGGLRIAMRKGANTYYLHKDHLGSTVAVTGEGGTVPVWRGNYLPFGALREESGTRVSNYLYTDQEYDPESGLYYFGARYYDPVLGRFLTLDSIVPRPYDPQSLNRYAYVRNSPASRIDPDGHTDLCISFGIGGISLSCPGGGGGPPPGFDPWSLPPGPYGGPYGGVPGGGGGWRPPLLDRPPPPTPQPNRPPPVVVYGPPGGTTGVSGPTGGGSVAPSQDSNGLNAWRPQPRLNPFAPPHPVDVLKVFLGPLMPSKPDYVQVGAGWVKGFGGSVYVRLDRFGTLSLGGSAAVGLGGRSFGVGIGTYHNESAPSSMRISEKELRQLNPLSLSWQAAYFGGTGSEIPWPWGSQWYSREYWLMIPGASAGVSYSIPLRELPVGW